MLKQTLRVLAAATLAAAGSAVIAASPAAAATITKILPIQSFGQIVADSAHLYLSDPASKDVLVTDHAGVKVTTLVAPTSGALLIDSGRLYVAESSADAIAVYDTSTLTPIGTYPVGVAAGTLAEAGGKIWFGYAGGGIGSLDLSGTDPVVTLAGRLDNWWTAAPELATSPGAPGLLTAVDTSSEPSSIAVFDVSTGTPATVNELGVGSLMETGAIAMSADGTEVLVTENGYTQGLSARDLSKVETYSSVGIIPDIAVSADGTIATGSRNVSPPDVEFFTPGTAAATQTFDLYRTGTSYYNDVVAPDGLAWEPGSSRLFTVAVSYADVYSLQVLNDHSKDVPAIALSVPTESQLGGTVTVAGFLYSKTIRLAGEPIVISRNGVALGTVTTGADGTFSLDDLPTATGKAVYTASFAGDDTYAAVSSTATVDVYVLTHTTVTIDHNKSIYNYGTTVTFTAHLGATYASRTLSVYADPAGSDQANRLLRTATADSKGNVTAAFKLSRDTTMSAVFAGDDRTPAVTARSTVYVHATVALALSKQYKNAKIGSTVYAYYHKSASPYFTTTINAYPGRKQYIEIQYYSAGKWHAYKSGYFALASNGKSVAVLSNAGVVGRKLRVRAAYLYGKSGDTANVTTYTAYKYFTYAK